jgi:hypothetical protein
MLFSSQVKAKYQIISDALGYISRKELQEKLPDLAKAYDDAYAKHLGSGGKRPDIQIVASDIFQFPHEKYSMGSWNIIYAMLDGQVKQLPVESYFGKQQKLVPGSMILDCLRGHVNACRLYVHPEDATPLLKEGEELTDEEYIALSVMKGLKPPARENEFYYIKYRHDNYEAKNKNPNEYKDALKSLEKKGLVKINSAGSAQLTLEGKNRALHASKVIKKYRGY